MFEKSAELGGMCRTLRHGEHLYDCGAHRFHDQDGEITRDVLELMGDEMLAVDAPSMIWDRGRFVDFPPTPLNAILSCGPIEALAYRRRTPARSPATARVRQLRGLCDQPNSAKPWPAGSR